MKTRIPDPQLKPAEQSVTVPLTLLVKLGSIAVYAEEYLIPPGQPVDKLELEVLLKDPDLQAWIGSMGPLLPLKR